MNKKNLSKLLIFLMTVSLGAVKVYAVEAEQSVETDVQPAIAITKSNSEVFASMTDYVNGIHSGFSTSFGFKNNNIDSNDHDIVITATTSISGATVSAYTQNGELIFAKIKGDDNDVGIHPSTSDYNNIRGGGSDNRNIIAYGINIIAPMPSSFVTDYPGIGECYVLPLGDNMEGSIIFTVGTSPVSGSYAIGMDQAGKYQATITVTSATK